MAKPYRQAPLIGADEASGLPLRADRVRKAAELLSRMVGRLDDDFILHVAVEIGLDECVSYAESAEALSFDLTSLQLVALSTALAACVEYRDAQPARCTCLRCKHRWRASREPMRCPSCGSERWNIARKPKRA